MKRRGVWLGLAASPLLMGAVAGGHFTTLLLTLAATIVATKLLGDVAQRIGQPAVLGELVAGVFLGQSALGLLDPSNETIAALAELGVVILLFEIGLHTNVRSLMKVGRSAIMVGLVGVVLPFTLGYWVASALGIPSLPAIVCGAALTATSIGISARVLSDLNRLQTREGQIVLGAAVIDDVIGLIILTVVASLTLGAVITPLTVGRIAGIAIGFVVAALVLGRWLAPPLFRLVQHIRATGALGLIALAFALFLAWLADISGSARIIGAFAAGLVLHETPQRREIEQATSSLGLLFVPIFFASVGAAVDLRTMADFDALMIGGALLVVAVVGKYAAGYAPWWFRGNKALIGVAMIPRGEVGLIFAQMGLSRGALDTQLFSAVTLMVIVTTFLAPPLLGRLSRATPTEDPLADTPGERPGDGGLDDLVAGSREEEAAELERAKRDGSGADRA
ncbi:MAG TPA: cation:proton antiporter [Gemmatimonadaceae bacterium]|nr:cation:proton antiporter [Gemmatimonadaceae bacterium]